MARPRTPEPAANTGPSVGKRTTLQEVARVCGVAPSTVSHILNGRSSCYASQETRKRVAEVARALGYRPNLAARALRGGTTATLGLISSALDVEVVAARCSAFEAAARKAGYLAMMSFNDPSDPALEDRLIGWLRDRCVDGIVIHPVEHSDNAALRELAAQKFPIVTLYGHGGLPGVCDVSMDYEAGGLMQGEHLVSLGRRRVCLVTRAPWFHTVSLRIAGLRRALDRAGCPPLTTVLLRTDAPSFNRTDEHDAQQLRSWFVEHRGRFDAVVGSNDECALCAMRALLELGIRVPDDVAVVGFDNTSSSRHAAVPLTTVAHPSLAIGQRAFELVSELVEGRRKPEDVERAVLQPTLVVRGSTVGAGR